MKVIKWVGRILYFIFMGLGSTMVTFGAIMFGIFWAFNIDGQAEQSERMFFIFIIWAVLAWISRIFFGFLTKCDCGGYITEDFNKAGEEYKVEKVDGVDVKYLHYRCSKCGGTHKKPIENYFY